MIKAGDFRGEYYAAGGGFDVWICRTRRAV